jgi:hypothetical protein
LQDNQQLLLLSVVRWILVMTLQIQSAFEDKSVEIQDNLDKDEVESVSKPFELNVYTFCEGIRLIFATIVVTLLMIVIVIGVANRWCVLQLHPALLFVILFVCIILLAYVEALHYGCK